MSKIQAQFKLAAGTLAFMCMLGFAQPQSQSAQIVHDAQYINIDASDENQIGNLNFNSINEDLDYLFFVHLAQDDVDMHVTVDTVDYSMPYDTTVGLYITDNTQVTRELESQINREITEYFTQKKQDYFAEQKEINDELETEYFHQNTVYWTSR